MPHLILEYSQKLEDQVSSTELLNKLHAIMLGSGLFNPEAVKSRSRLVTDYLVGNKAQEGDFIHVSVSLLEGRTEEQRALLSSKIFEETKKYFGDIDSISVEIREMLKATYCKM